MNRIAHKVAHRVATFIVAGAVLAGTSTNTRADILFETGTLGPTGVTREDVTNQIVLGANLNSNAFNGVRFELSQAVLTSQIGGHFVGTPNGSDTLFGAIIALDNKDDFPNSNDLSSSDVLGTTLLDFPEPSDVVFGGLALTLRPGWYAVVFGSGLFESFGDGAALLNNTDVGMQSYIGFLRGFGWGNRDPGTYSVIEGTIVPEVSSLVLALVASCVMVFLGVDRLRRATRRFEL